MFKKFFKDKKVKGLSKLAKKFQISIIITLIGLALIGVGLSVNKISTNNQEPQFIDSEGSSQAGEGIVVDISGAVEKPGVYEFEADTRVMEAVEKAGGFSADADKDWIAESLNLAEKISDGQKIFIPARGQGASVSSGSVAGEQTGKININTASESQLDSLPDIGPVRAGKIIANRPYKTIDELVLKKAVGTSTFEKIKDKISVF